MINQSNFCKASQICWEFVHVLNIVKTLSKITSYKEWQICFARPYRQKPLFIVSFKKNPPFTQKHLLKHFGGMLCFFFRFYNSKREDFSNQKNKARPSVFVRPFHIHILVLRFWHLSKNFLARCVVLVYLPTQSQNDQKSSKKKVTKKAIMNGRNCE